MRRLSWKALPISNVTYFVVLLFVIVSFSLIVEIILHLSQPEAPTHKTSELLESSKAFFIAVMVFSLGSASVAAGYIAGRIAKKQFFLNGAMGTAVMALWSLYELVIGPLFQTETHIPPWLDKLSDVWAALPGVMLGALGGYFAKLRQAQLDVMSAEERAARGLRINVVVAVRWILAFCVAVIVYFGVFKLGMMTVGPFRWLPVAATGFAIIAGTFVFPPLHRKAGCLLLIAVVIIVPLAILLRHVWLGDANYGHSFLVLYNALGAMLTYQSLESSFQTGTQTGRARWWWLSTRRSASFSNVERVTRRYLLFIGLATGLLLYFLVLAAAGALGVDAHLTIVSFILTLPLGFIAARPIYAFFSPDILQQADRDAAVRLGAASATGLG